MAERSMAMTGRSIMPTGETYAEQKRREAIEGEAVRAKRVADQANSITGFPSAVKRTIADKFSTQSPMALKAPTIADPAPAPSLPVNNIGSVASAPASSVVSPAPKIQTPAVAKAPGITASNVPAPTPAVQTSSNMADDTIAPQQTNIPVEKPAEKPSIVSGMGKWLDDPKIAKSLAVAGLSMLATEPRRVPYSNAEILGKAGLTGMDTYDNEVAKEGAAKELARKAGIESRDIASKEKMVDIQEGYRKAQEEALRQPNAVADNNIVHWKGVTGYPIYNTKSGEIMKVMPAPQSAIDALKKAGKDANSDEVKDIASTIETYDKMLLEKKDDLGQEIVLTPAQERKLRQAREGHVNLLKTLNPGRAKAYEDAPPTAAAALAELKRRQAASQGGQ